MRLVVAFLVCSGCSAIFMEKLPATFDAKREEPRCSATKGFAYWDGFNAAGAILGALIAFSADAPIDEQTGEPDSDAEQTTKLLGGALAVDAIIHIASAVKGGGWADDCRRAREERARAQQPAPVVKPAPAPLVAPPRGFFCSSRACDRDKTVCEQTRLAIGDGSSCALVESAFCFPLSVGGASCAPSSDECAQRKTLAGDAASGECAEQK